MFIGILAGLFMIGISIKSWLDIRRLIRHGTTVSVTVISLKRIKSPWQITVEYWVDGETRTQIFPTSLKKFDVGEHFYCRYDPYKKNILPEHELKAQKIGQFAFAITGAIFIAICYSIMVGLYLGMAIGYIGGIVLIKRYLDGIKDECLYAEPIASLKAYKYELNGEEIIWHHNTLYSNKKIKLFHNKETNRITSLSNLQLNLFGAVIAFTLSGIVTFLLLTGQIIL